MARKFSDPLALGDHDKAGDAGSLAAKILRPFLRIRRTCLFVTRRRSPNSNHGVWSDGGDPAALVGTLKGGGLAHEVAQEGGVSSKPGHLDWM